MPKVWVVVSDCGLNGPVVHGVFTTEPDSDEVARFVRQAPAGHVRASGSVAAYTGYQATHIVAFDLDAPLVQSGEEVGYV